MKRTAGFLLCLLMLAAALFSCAEETAYTNGDFGYSLSGDGSAVITKYGGRETRLKIPAELDGHPVREIGSGAFYGCEDLTEVTIPEGVTAIGENAFAACLGMTSVTIPESVAEIRKGAFHYCLSLTEASIPGGVRIIGEGAFSECESLETLVIPEGVAAIGDRAFFDCRALKKVTLPGSLTELGVNPWSNCPELTDIAVSPENPVLIMEGGALYCRAEGRLVWVPMNTEGCFEIPEGTKIIGGDAFIRCAGLTSVVIPEGTEIIGNSAFRGCTGLTAADLPEGVISIGSGAFSGCENLLSVKIPESVTEVGDNPWLFCPKADVSVSEKHTTLFAEDGALYCGADGRLVWVSTNLEGDFVIPRGTRIIGMGAFFGCSRLTNVSIPDSVVSIGDEAFSMCPSLTSIVIPESVTSIGFPLFSPGVTVIAAEGSYAEEYCRIMRTPYTTEK